MKGDLVQCTGMKLILFYLLFCQLGLALYSLLFHILSEILLLYVIVFFLFASSFSIVFSWGLTWCSYLQLKYLISPFLFTYLNFVYAVKIFCYSCSWMSSFCLSSADNFTLFFLTCEQIIFPLSVRFSLSHNQCSFK